MEHKVLTVQQDHKEPRVLKEQQEIQVLKEIRVTKDTMVHKEI